MARVSPYLPFKIQRCVILELKSLVAQSSLNFFEFLIYRTGSTLYEIGRYVLYLKLRYAVSLK